MFETTLEVPMTGDGAADAEAAPLKAPERAGNSVCPHCTYVNYCDWDSGHSGSCHCSNGHYWGYGC